MNPSKLLVLIFFFAFAAATLNAQMSPNQFVPGLEELDYRPIEYPARQVPRTPITRNRLHINNGTDKQVKVALEYRDLNNNWQLYNWLTIEPNKTVFFARTSGPNAYLYAESIDPSKIWGGSKMIKLDDRDEEVGFRRISSVGTYSLTEKNVSR